MNEGYKMYEHRGGHVLPRLHSRRGRHIMSFMMTVAALILATLTNFWSTNFWSGHQLLWQNSSSSLPPCLVLITNTPPWHQEVLESVAKQFPIQNLDLVSAVAPCNPFHLVFDYLIQDCARSRLWLDYFSEYLANTTHITIDAKSGRKVRRDVRFASIAVGAQLTDPVQREKLSFDNRTTRYHAMIETSCYCKEKGWEWIGEWFLDGLSNDISDRATRSCIFHEGCPGEFQVPQSIWVSPHHTSYFIPTSLPLAESTTEDLPPPQQQVSFPPVVCSIGETRRRNFNYVAAYLTNNTKKTTEKFLLLGAGGYPKALYPFNQSGSVEQAQPYDHVEFHRQIKEECDVVAFLVDSKDKNYFLKTNSKLKLSGTIPFIIAYRKPFVVHREILQLYKKELLPLDVPHATFDDNVDSFGPALHSVLGELSENRGVIAQGVSHSAKDAVHRSMRLFASWFVQSL